MRKVKTEDKKQKEAKNIQNGHKNKTNNHIETDIMEKRQKGNTKET